MSLKLKVFAQMVIGLVLMILILFDSLKRIQTASYSLIDQLSDNMYLEQQDQTSTLFFLKSNSFNHVFQRLSESYQAIHNYEQKIIQSKVNLESKFIFALGNREKLWRGTEVEPIQSRFNKDMNTIDIWFNKDTLEFNELDEQIKGQLKIVEYASLLFRVVRIANNLFDPDKRKIEILDFVYGLADGGSIYGKGVNASFALYKPPPACPYLGKYKFDPRCRIWVIQPSKQNKITPIEPNLVFGETSPFQATNFCKSQRKYEKDENGNLIQTNCTYSSSCLALKLKTLKNYFDENNFNFSTSIMIDPRSQIIVYNQLQNITSNITRLINATIQIFPNNTQTQNSFIQEVTQKMQRNNNQLGVDQTKGRLIFDEKKKCEYSPFKIEKLLNIKPVNYGNFAFTVPKIDMKNDKSYQSSSFILNSGQKDEVFVTLNYIYIIEKLLKNSFQKEFEIQDLFVIINVLPKSMLTSQTEKLKEKVHLYLIWVSIGLSILCAILLIIAGVISYQVAVMIEKPLLHMINMLNILDKEGCGAAIDLIDEEITDVDQIFLSKDSKILFQSFRRIIEMLQLATEDIFTVEDSCSLIRLNYQINFFQEFNNIRVLGICYNNMGNIHLQNGRYIESMEAYQNSIILAQQEAGFYQEQLEIEEYCFSQEYYLNRVTNEFYKEEVSHIQQTKPKLSILSLLYSKMKRSISTTFMDKRISEQLSIDILNDSKQWLKENSQEKDARNYSRYKNVSSQIKQIIFDRKLNFSHALYMHCISQEAEGKVIESSQHNKILNNPLNYKKSQCSLTYSSPASIMFEWENYEEILLDLIELSEGLKIHSFGRTVILLTQLSLCHLKMGKIEQASDEQAFAIDNYQCAFTLEQLRNKNSQNIKSQIFQTKESLSNLSIHPKFNEARKSGQEEGISVDPNNMTLSNSQKESIQIIYDSSRYNETSKLLETKNQIKEIEKSNIQIHDKLSLFSQLKKRQSALKKKLEQNNFLKDSNLSLVDFSKSFQIFKEESMISKNPSQNISFCNEIEEKKIIKEQNINFKEQKIHPFLSSSSNQTNILLSEIPNKHDEQNAFTNKSLNSVQNSFKTLLPNQIIKNISYLVSINTSNSDPKKKKKKESLSKIQINKRDMPLTPTLFKSKKSLNSPSIIELNEVKKNKEQKNLDSNSQRSPYLNLRTRKNILPEGDKIAERNKIQSLPLFKKSSKSKIINTYLNSKVNKNLFQGDLEQILRYELPSDILLYYITLQEARLLILENNSINSAFILTNLLEKTQYYLPYYRLACLEVLSYVTQSNEKIECQINKLKKRFDLDIQFNASIVIAVDSGKQEAFNTIITLVNDVFTKDEDIFSLLIYEQNSLKQLITSISLKQLRLTCDYFEQFLDTIFSEDLKSKQFPFLELNGIPSSLLDLSENQNQKQSRIIENISSGENKVKQLNNINSQKKSHIIQDEQLSPKQIDSQQKFYSFKQDPSDQSQMIQLIPQLRSRINISKLSQKPNKDVKESQNIDNFSFQNKKSILLNEKSPATSSNNLSNLKDEINKSQSFVFEAAEGLKMQQNENRSLENSGTYLLQNKLKKEKYQAYSMEDQFYSPYVFQNIDSFNLKSSKDHQIQMNNSCFSYQNEKKNEKDCNQPQKFNLLSSKNMDNCQSKNISLNNFKEVQKGSFNMNLIFHLAARQCIQNFYNQDLTKYEIQQKSIKEGIISKKMKLIIFITDKLEIIINKAYQMLSNLLYSSQARLLILLLNEDECVEEDYAFKDVQINGKIVIKYFYSQDNLIQYIRNKREQMKNFGVPVLVEHLNM